METTKIEIPTELLEAAGLTPEDVRLELAVHLFKQGRITEAQVHALGGNPIRREELLPGTEPFKMDAFISSSAHDLKSPLNAIIGFTKVVLKGIDGPLTDLQVTDLSSVNVSGQRMLTLITNLIEMARLSNGDIKVEKAPCDLAETLFEAANRWKTQNPGKLLETDLAINAPGIAVDSARTRQIISGLLTYAANHVAEGGAISLRAKADETSLQVEIESRGEKARDKFELELSMQEYICRGLIGLHGGSLEIDKDTGAGLALSFRLPKR